MRTAKVGDFMGRFSPSACTGGEEDEDERRGRNEKGRRDETALSKRKQDEGAPFRVQTAPSRTAKHHPLPHPLFPSLFA